MKVAQFTKPLTVVFAPEVYGEIQRLSNEQKTSMGEILRRMVNQCIETDETRDRTKSSGLAL